VHLVGFTIEIYHDARPHEHQIYRLHIFVIYNVIILIVRFLVIIIIIIIIICMFHVSK